MCLLLAMPLLLCLVLLLWLVDGRPVFYGGLRLGIGKRRFVMFKFRTLVVGADKATGSNLVRQDQPVFTRLGRFLRDTRLDELPQLLNVIRGDMVFIGPRPVRPEVYAEHCASIPAYDVRFRVKPGVLGYSQVFTPHSTPKRIRSRIDNRFVLRPPNLPARVALISYTFAILVVKPAVHVARRLASLRRTNDHGGQSPGLPVTAASLVYHGQVTSTPVVAALTNIDDCVLCIQAQPEALPSQPITFRLVRSLACERRPGKKKKKTAVCTGVVRQVVTNGSALDNILIEYSPATPLDRYILDQYFLMKSVVSPF